MNSKIKKTFILLSFSLIFPLIGCKKGEADKTVNLKFLVTSDLHGMMFPFDYSLYEEVNTGSFVQIGTIINKLRNENTITIDVGDISQGNYAEMFKNEDIHPMIAGLNTMNYDVFVIGNHEFNHGVDFIERQSKKFNGATLCGNVINKETGKTLANPYTIITKDDVRVAIIGMVSPCIQYWDGDKLTNWNVKSSIDKTKEAIKEIKEGNKADVIVAAEHMGLSREYSVGGSSVKEIAEQCDGLDLVIGAHEHTAVNEKINNVLVVENQSDAKTLVEVNLEVKGKKGNFQVNKDSVKGNIHDLKEEKPDADEKLSELFKPYDAKAKEDAKSPIGQLINGPLSKPFEINKVPSTYMGPDGVSSLINETQISAGNKYLDKMGIKDKKVKISSTAVGTYGANITEETIKKHDISLIYKYVNTLYILQMNKTQLKKYLEYSYQFINQYKSGDLTISFSSEMPNYLYDLFAGIRFEVDISKSVGERIVNLRWDDGTNIDENEVFYITVNNYRANSQLLKYGSVFSEGDILPSIVYPDIENGTGIREMIIDYIKNEKKGEYDVDQITYKDNWKFVGNNWDENKHNEAVKAINDNKFDIGLYNTITMTEKDLESIKK